MKFLLMLFLDHGKRESNIMLKYFAVVACKMDCYAVVLALMEKMAVSPMKSMKV